MAFYIPPDDVLKINRKVFSSDTLNSTIAKDIVERATQEQEDRRQSNLALEQALAQAQAEQEKADNPGFFDRAKSVAGEAIGGALQAIDIPRAAFVASGSTFGDALRAIIRDRSPMTPGDIASTWTERVAKHEGTGDVVERAFPDLPLPVKQGLGAAGDIAADPLNALTFGASPGAKAALATIERAAGKDVAETLAREGVEAANQKIANQFVEQAGKDLVERSSAVPSELTPRVVGNAARPEEVLGRYAEHRLVALPEELYNPRAFDRVAQMFPEVASRPPTIQTILAQAASPLSKRTVEEQVARGLTALEQGSKGGLGVGGVTTGLGQETAEKFASALRNTELGKAVRPLLVPTAEVRDKLGVQASEAVDVALHTGGTARRQAARDIRRQIAEGTADASTDVWKHSLGASRKAMVDDLADLAPDLVSDVAKPGFKELEGRYVPSVVADTIKRSAGIPPGEALNLVDKGLTWLKRYTTLGPLNAVPHVGRNIFSNHLFAALFGHTGPQYFSEARKLRNAYLKAAEEGAVGVEDLVRHGLTEKEAARALAMRDQELVGRGGYGVYDDIGGEEAVRKDLLGTRTASKVNGWHEELSRGAVFLKGLDDGLDPRLAAQASRRAMLDYSNEGLTQFEQKVLQRVVFFYKFPRRAVPEGLRFMVRYPGIAKSVSTAGFGASLGNRNQYGEPIGTYFDTPLEATVQNLHDLATDPTGYANPVIQAILDDKKRDLTDLIPALGQGERLTERTPEETATIQGLGAFGLRIGKDYEQQNAQRDVDEFRSYLQQRIARGQDPTPTDQLKLLALEKGVPNAARLSSAQLAQALVDLGVSRQKIGRILANKA